MDQYGWLQNGFFNNRVHIMANNAPVENFKRRWKNYLDVNMATLSTMGVLKRPSSLGNLKPHVKKLGLQRTPT